MYKETRCLAQALCMAGKDTARTPHLKSDVPGVCSWTLRFHSQLKKKNSTVQSIHEPRSLTFQPTLTGKPALHSLVMLCQWWLWKSLQHTDYGQKLLGTAQNYLYVYDRWGKH